jgi:SAM-dependent methyltransferase
MHGKKPFKREFWLRYIRRLQPHGALLDLGCGKGFFLELAQKYYLTYGVDVSQCAINYASERCPSSELHVMDASHLDFDSHKFDIVVCFDVLEHVVEPYLVVGECRRTMKKDGLFIMSVPNLNSFGRFLKQKDWFGYRDQTHVSLLSKVEWISLLENAGLRIIDLRYDGLWDSPYLRKLPTLPQHFFFKFLSTILFAIGFPFTEKFSENLCVVAQANL